MCWRCGRVGHTRRECPYVMPLGNPNVPAHNSHMNCPPVPGVWKGKGKQIGKESGKGAYEIHQDEQFEKFEEQIQEESSLHGLGGGDVDEVERPWTHVMRKPQRMRCEDRGMGANSHEYRLRCNRYGNAAQRSAEVHH